MASVPEDERSAPRRPACSWAVVKDEDGSIWYEKRATGERQRDKPAEVAAVEKDPRTWFECRSKDGKVFYKNSATGGKAWEKPVDPSRTGSPWAERAAEDGRTFWKNLATGEKTWDDPFQPGFKRRDKVPSISGKESTRGGSPGLPPTGSWHAASDRSPGLVPRDRAVLPDDSPTRRYPATRRVGNALVVDNTHLELLSAERNVEAGLRKAQEQVTDELRKTVVEQQQQIARLAEKLERSKGVRTPLTAAARRASVSPPSPLSATTCDRATTDDASTAASLYSAGQSGSPSSYSPGSQRRGAFGISWDEYKTPTGLPFWVHRDTGKVSIQRPLAEVEEDGQFRREHGILTMDQAYSLAQDICDSTQGVVLGRRKPEQAAEVLLMEYVAQCLSRKVATRVQAKAAKPPPRPREKHRSRRPRESERRPIVVNLDLVDDGSVSVSQPHVSGNNNNNNQTLDVALNVYRDHAGNIVSIEPSSSAEPQVGANQSITIPITVDGGGAGCMGGMSLQDMMPSVTEGLRRQLDALGGGGGVQERETDFDLSVQPQRPPGRDRQPAGNRRASAAPSDWSAAGGGLPREHPEVEAQREIIAQQQQQLQLLQARLDEVARSVDVSAKRRPSVAMTMPAYSQHEPVSPAAAPYSPSSRPADDAGREPNNSFGGLGPPLPYRRDEEPRTMVHLSEFRQYEMADTMRRLHQLSLSRPAGNAAPLHVSIPRDAVPPPFHQPSSQTNNRSREHDPFRQSLQQRSMDLPHFSPLAESGAPRFEQPTRRRSIAL